MLKLDKSWVIKDKVYDFLIPKIKVEAQQQQGYTEVLALLPIIFNYLVFNILIQTATFSEVALNVVPESLFYIPLAVRSAATILFIIFQKIPFMLIDKLAFLVQILLFAGANRYEGVPVLLLQFVGATVYSLTKEKRIGNLDARFSITPLLQKQCIFIFCLGFFKHAESMGQRLAILLVCFIAYIYLNSAELLYNWKLSYSVKMADVWVISSLLMRIVNLGLGFDLNFGVFVLVDSLDLIMCTIIAWLGTNSYAELYQVDLEKLGKNSEENLIRLFISLLSLSKEDRSDSIDLFVIYHREVCSNPHCWLLPNERDLKKVTNRQLLRIFIEKQLAQLTVGRSNLRKLLVYMLSPSQKIFKFLDQEKADYFIKREIFRIESEKKMLQDSDIKAQTLRQNEVSIKNDLLSYLRCANRFWAGLAEIKIDSADIMESAVRMMEYFEKIKSTKNRNHQLSAGSRICINNFMKHVANFNGDFLPKIENPPYLMTDVNESKPTLIISADGKNYGYVIDANKSMTKLTYYSKETLCSLNLIEIVPIQVREHHKNHLEKVRRIERDTVRNFENTIFLHNRINYAVPLKAFIYNLNAVSGKKWCVVCQRIYERESILFIDEKGFVIGVTENMMEVGFDNTIYGKQLIDPIVSHLKRKNKAQGAFKLESNKALFRDSNISSNKTLSFRKIEDIFYHIRYFVVEVAFVQSQRKELSRTKTEGSRFQTRISHIIGIDPTNSSQKKFSFHMNFDGSIRNYKTEYQNNEQRIEELDRTFGKKFIESFARDKNWGEDIVEMRYVKGVLDYVENIEVEEFQDTQHKPKDLKHIPFDSSEEFYRQTLELRKHKTPRWLIKLRVLFLVLLIGLLGISTSVFVISETQIQKNVIRFEILSIYANDMVNSVNIGSLAITRIFSFKFNEQQVINDNLQQIEKGRRRLNQIGTSIQVMEQNITVDYYEEFYGRKASLHQINEQFNLVLNSFINDVDQPYTSLLNLLIRGIYHGKYELISQLRSNHQQKNIFATILLTVLVGFFFVFSVIMGIAIYLFFLHFIRKEKLSIMAILASLKSKTIEQMIQKLTTVEKHLYFDSNIEDSSGNSPVPKKSILEGSKQFDYKGDANPQRNLKCEDEACQQEVKRKVMNISSDITILIQSWLWLGSITALLVGIVLMSNRFGQVSNNIEIIRQQMGYMVASANMVWVGLNSFPNYLFLIDYFEENLYESEKNFKDMSMASFNMHYFSNDFNEFYNNFWDEDVCQYISKHVPTCETDLNGALKEGMDQAIAFLNRKYDFIMHHNYTKEEFYRLKILPEILDIQLKYLDEINEEISVRLDSQHQSNANYYFYIILALYLACLLLIGLGVLVYRKLSQNSELLIRLQKMLAVVPYDDLVDIYDFRKFAREKIKNEVN